MIRYSYYLHVKRLESCTGAHATADLEVQQGSVKFPEDEEPSKLYI